MGPGRFVRFSQPHEEKKMKRILTGSFVALGLLACTAHGQQNNNNDPNQNQNNQQQTQRRDNPNQSSQQNNQPQSQNTQNNQAQSQPQNFQPQNAQTQQSTNVNTQATTAGQAAAGNGTLVNGRIVRTGQDQFIVQGVDNKQYTFYTNPQTTYWSNNNPIQYSNLQVGSNVSAWYVPQGSRYIANRVSIVPANATAPAPETATTQVQPVQQVPAPQAANATAYQGEVIRLSGNNQVVIRTSDGKEIIVQTTPQTTYQLNEQPATYTQLQPGAPVRVDYYMQDNRPYARGIFGLRRR